MGEFSLGGSFISGLTLTFLGVGVLVGVGHGEVVFVGQNVEQLRLEQPARRRLHQTKRGHQQGRVALPLEPLNDLYLQSGGCGGRRGKIESQFRIPD